MLRRRTYGSKADANTVLLLHFDDSLTKDSSGNNHTVNIVGSPSLSTSSKFGTGSLLANSLSNYIYTSASVVSSAVSSGNFTIECWAVSTSTNDSAVFAGNSTAGMFGLALNTMYANNVAMAFGSFYEEAKTISTSGLSMYSFAHIAVSCKDGYLRVFYNGSIVMEKASMSFNVPTTNFCIGGGISNALNSVIYIDEFRVSNIARYTAAFTPQASAF